MFVLISDNNTTVLMKNNNLETFSFIRHDGSKENIVIRQHHNAFLWNTFLVNVELCSGKLRVPPNRL